jgi:hypothetical protein
MTESSKPVKPVGTITDPETGEQLKIIPRKGPETWMDKFLRERGITVHHVEPPKGFCRVIIPGIPMELPPDNEKPDEPR